MSEPCWRMYRFDAPFQFQAYGPGLKHLPISGKCTSISGKSTTINVPAYEAKYAHQLYASTADYIPSIDDLARTCQKEWKDNSLWPDFEYTRGIIKWVSIAKIIAFCRWTVSRFMIELSKGPGEKSSWVYVEKSPRHECQLSDRLCLIRHTCSHYHDEVDRKGPFPTLKGYGSEQEFIDSHKKLTDILKQAVTAKPKPKPPASAAAAAPKPAPAVSAAAPAPVAESKKRKAVDPEPNLPFDHKTHSSRYVVIQTIIDQQDSDPKLESFVTVNGFRLRLKSIVSGALHLFSTLHLCAEPSGSKGISAIKRMGTYFTALVEEKKKTEKEEPAEHVEILMSLKYFYVLHKAYWEVIKFLYYVPRVYHASDFAEHKTDMETLSAFAAEYMHDIQLRVSFETNVDSPALCSIGVVGKSLKTILSELVRLRMRIHPKEEFRFVEELDKRDPGWKTRSGEFKCEFTLSRLIRKEKQSIWTEKEFAYYAMWADWDSIAKTETDKEGPLVIGIAPEDHTDQKFIDQMSHSYGSAAAAAPLSLCSDAQPPPSAADDYISDLRDQVSILTRTNEDLQLTVQKLKAELMDVQKKTEEVGDLFEKSASYALFCSGAAKKLKTIRVSVAPPLADSSASAAAAAAPSK